MAWFSTKVAEKLGLPPGTLIYTGEKSAGATRITMVQYSALEMIQGSYTNWDAAARDLKPDLKKWVHVEGLGDVKVIESIGQAFGIHTMSLEDILNSHHRPKMTDVESYLLFVTKLVTASAKTPGGQIDHFCVVLGRDFVISFTERPSEVLRPIYERFRNANGRIRKLGSPYLAFTIMDLMLDHFHLVVSRLGEAVDQMETTILRRPSDFLLSKLYEVKREAALMRKLAQPVKDFTHKLVVDSYTLIDERYEIYYRDLEDHATQIVDTCEALKEALRNLLDVSDSYSAHNSNVMFKFFTAVSAIFLPLNFLASVYGMNFHFMPGLDHPSGFFYMSLAMVLVALFVALFFRLKRWW